ncbi:hypothetical protein H6784_02365 [Candidatus Nomurabacteria bacterium]|nr:hypothetical protein [Candidatus Nomurabacteria bacterium]
MTSHSLVTLNGDNDQTATGTMTGTSALRNVSFTGVGTKTFQTTPVLQISRLVLHQ